MKDLPFQGQIIPINKPAGITSFGVIRRVRKATGVKKVGHAGTLDPFAQGVLVVGFGRSATRRLGEFMLAEKEYLAEVKLGTVTDTYDLTGKVLEQRDFIHPGEDKIRAVFTDYVGKIEQIPPLYSAIKVNGLRMYKAARRGLEIERKPRSVEILSIKLEELTAEGFVMRVICSHGTYIRSLAYDIGRQLGPGAHLSGLIRTRVGSFNLGEAIELDDFVEQAYSLRNKNFIDHGEGTFERDVPEGIA